MRDLAMNIFALVQGRKDWIMLFGIPVFSLARLLYSGLVSVSDISFV